MSAPSRDVIRTVTAVVPAYNGARTIERCLDSLSSQSSALVEVLVIDDASVDATPAILETCGKRDPRFVTIRHSANLGIARTLNEGIALARGDAVLILHQDCELLGPDWVDRARALANNRPHTCLVGWPEYPFQELNAVELAFGVLRDTFYTPPTDEEGLGFSEYKCDLLPKDALRVARFDERFRSSGEDQVLSIALADAGFLILRTRDLAYVQRFGNASTLRSQLRKEIAYGRTEGGALLQTGFRIATVSARSKTSARRLMSRTASVLFASGILAILLLELLTGNPWLLFPLIPVLFLRVWIVLSRGRFLRARLDLPRTSLLLAVLLSPLADLVYSSSLVAGLISYATSRRV